VRYTKTADGTFVERWMATLLLLFPDLAGQSHLPCLTFATHDERKNERYYEGMTDHDEANKKMITFYCR